MRERLTVLFAGITGALFLPFLITMGIHGVSENVNLNLSESDSGKTVTVAALGESISVDLEVFLVQVLAAQISPDSEEEALKAQAVIARTMLKKAMEATDIADSASLGIDYLTDGQCKSQWGNRRYETYYERLQDAVLDTYGQTLQYENTYIEAMYHSVSMGVTMSASEAYGKDIPYLTQVSCSQDVESVEYMQMNLYTWEEMVAVLNTLNSQGLLEGFSLEETQNMPLEERIRVETATEHGYVQSVLIGSVYVGGDDFAQAADLQSHVYYIETVDEQYRIICLGKGHGIGLSQYAANLLAKEGWTYEEILQHFYPGTSLVSQ